MKAFFVYSTLAVICTISIVTTTSLPVEIMAAPIQDTPITLMDIENSDQQLTIDAKPKSQQRVPRGLIGLDLLGGKFGGGGGGFGGGLGHGFKGLGSFGGLGGFGNLKGFGGGFGGKPFFGKLF